MRKLKMDNKGYSLAFVIGIITIVMLLISSCYVMVSSSFRLNHDAWKDEQAYMSAKSAVDLIATEFTNSTESLEEIYEFYILNNIKEYTIHDFDSALIPGFSTDVQVALLSQNRMALLAVSKNGDSSKGIIAFMQSDRQIDEIDYEKGIIYYEDDYAPPFEVVGYKVLNSIDGEQITIENELEIVTPEEILKPEDDKEGAVDATFFIRLDGKIPYEPGNYSSSQYTQGVFVEDALVKAEPIANDFKKVKENIAKEPTSEEIKAVLPGYDPLDEYILWYVIKEAGTWHVDGVVLDRDKFNVTYNPNFEGWNANVNGNVPMGVQCEYGSMYNVDTAASNMLKRDKYALTGWIRSDTKELIPVDGAFEMPEHNVVLYAHWSPEFSLFNFYMNDGTDTLYTSEQVGFGDKATRPTDPRRSETYTINGVTYDYYTFDGWYTSAKGTEKWDFNTVPNRPMDLYAHWRITSEDIKYVDFMMNSGDFNSIYKREYTLKGGVVADPGIPKRLGYIFLGWFDSHNGETLYDFSTRIYDNSKVYAHWKEALKVRYADNGEPTIIPNDYTEEGNLVTVNDTILTKDGKYFAGWIPDFDKDEVFYGLDTFIMPDHHVTLNARWVDSPLWYILKYNANYPDNVTNKTGEVPNTEVYGINKVTVADNEFACDKLVESKPCFNPHSRVGDPESILGTVSKAPNKLGTISTEYEIYYLYGVFDNAPMYPVEIEIEIEDEDDDDDDDDLIGIRAIVGECEIDYEDDDDDDVLYGSIEEVELELDLGKPKYNKNNMKECYEYSLGEIEKALNDNLTDEAKRVLGVNSIKLYVGDKDGNDLSFKSTDTIFRAFGLVYDELDESEMEFEQMNVAKNTYDVYEFVSWNTKPNGQGVEFNPGDLWVSENDDGDTMDLYAQWVVKNQIVRYEPIDDIDYDDDDDDDDDYQEILDALDKQAQAEKQEKPSKDVKPDKVVKPAKRPHGRFW